MLIYIKNYTQTVMLCHTVGNGRMELDCSAVRMSCLFLPHISTN